MAEVQTCPRRMSEVGAWKREEGLDRWRQLNGTPDRHCDFCGSLHPDDVVRRLEEGAEVTATDKAYKMYLTAPLFHTKVYFQHFEEPHRDRFLELLNGRQVRFTSGYGFYVLPFFLQRGNPPSGADGS